MDWIQITNLPDFAAFAVQCGVARLMLDLESLGKQARQGGLGTFISDHRPQDLAPLRAAAPRAHLIVRVNPWHEGSVAEVEHAVRHGADSVMLPMFEQPAQLQACAEAIGGRARLIALLETRGALDTLDTWADQPGLSEIYVGLNDLHRQLELRFMFEPLADGTVERVARAAHARDLRFGFGGIARIDEGLLPGRVVLGEHLRLGSQSVILSRTFNREMFEDPDSDWRETYHGQLTRLQHCEAVLAARSAEEVESDRLLACDLIGKAARTLAAPRA